MEFMRSQFPLRCLVHACSINPSRGDVDSFEKLGFSTDPLYSENMKILFSNKSKMMKIILAFGIVFTMAVLCNNLYADTWYSFSKESKDGESYIGFMDKKGNVKIEPKFGGLTDVDKFDDIVAVLEVINDSLESYYLLKSGKKIGHEMMWVEDLAFDCENERHIRFKDPNKDLIGMFDYKGDIVIPPIYNSLSKVYNGLVIGRLNAKKIRAEDKETDCNHYSLVGGKTILLNTNNEVLIDNFDADLDLYSLHIEQKPSTKNMKKVI